MTEREDRWSQEQQLGALAEIHIDNPAKVAEVKAALTQLQSRLDPKDAVVVEAFRQKAGWVTQTMKAEAARLETQREAPVAPAETAPESAPPAPESKPQPEPESPDDEEEEQTADSDPLAAVVSAVPRFSEPAIFRRGPRADRAPVQPDDELPAARDTEQPEAAPDRLSEVDQQLLGERLGLDNLTGLAIGDEVVYDPRIVGRSNPTRGRVAGFTVKDDHAYVLLQPASGAPRFPVEVGLVHKRLRRVDADDAPPAAEPDVEPAPDLAALRERLAGLKARDERLATLARVLVRRDQRADEEQP